MTQSDDRLTGSTTVDFTLPEAQCQAPARWRVTYQRVLTPGEATLHSSGPDAAFLDGEIVLAAGRL